MTLTLANGQAGLLACRLDWNSEAIEAKASAPQRQHSLFE
jgi:hypothetical protein